jgi:predicted  nucleic acid-binding Zn-ribbon protein
MSQLEQLWDYQLADVEADNAKRELAQSPQRRRLLQLRDNIKEQQDFLQMIDDERAAMLDRLTVLKEVVALSENQLRQFHGKVTSSPAQSVEEAQTYVEEMQALIDSLNEADKEIRRIHQSAEERDRRHREVLLNAVKLKTEFDEQRESYNAEYKERAKKIQELEAIVKAKEKNIDPKLLAKYNHVKEHAVPPMAKLVDNRCSGCNMSFPSSVLRAIQAGEQTECETCGRMIIL